MNTRKKLLFLITFFIVMDLSAAKNRPDATVRFETTYGSFTVKLYAETPKHRENFLKLIDEGFYNGVLFHRVIADFMIQAGDPQSKTATSSTSLGAGDVGYTIPAEFVYPKFYHKRGALSAARMGDQVNPQKASSGCQFYVVQGRVFTDKELDSMEKNNQQKLEAALFHEILNTKQDEVKKYRLERNQTKLDQLRDSILTEVHKKMEQNAVYKFTEQQRKDYKTIGGTPHLDGEYTVFGEVTEGLEVIEKISKAKTGSNDRPLEDIKIIKAERK